MFAKLTKAAGRLVSGRVVIVLITAAAGLATWAGWATWKMEQLQKQAGRCEIVEETAASNAAATVALAGRLSRCVNQSALDLEAERAANSTLERENRRITEAANAERKSRDEIYSTVSSCKAWRDRITCEPIGRRLFESAESLQADTGGSSDAGDSENTGGKNGTDNGDE